MAWVNYLWWRPQCSTAMAIMRPAVNIMLVPWTPKEHHVGSLNTKRTSCWFPEHQRINYAESWSHVFHQTTVQYIRNLAKLSSTVAEVINDFRMVCESRKLNAEIIKRVIGKPTHKNTSYWSDLYISQSFFMTVTARTPKIFRFFRL
jgi:hypothetical protein